METKKMIELTEKLIKKKNFALNQCILTFWSTEYSKNCIDFTQKYIVGYLLDLIHREDSSFFVRQERNKWYWYSNKHTHLQGYRSFHEALAFATVEILE